MILESKFNIGDKVYSIPPLHIEYPKIRIPCNICDSTGEVSIKRIIFTCPKCEGKFKEDYDNSKHFFPYPAYQPKTIGQIRFNFTEDKEERKYMCKETGIGSGTVYDENRLFSTYAEAVAFVENANEQMANGKHWSEIP